MLPSPSSRYRHLATALLCTTLLTGCAGGQTKAADQTAAMTTPAASKHTGLPTQQDFIDDMVTRHGFERAWLTRLMSQVEIRDDILRIITRPAEGKPWHQYREIFVTDARIRGGVDFWRDNADTLARAEREYGVPAQVIVAIIGVETRYGANMGSHRVIDALATLGFHYPKRADFFRKELENFLLLSREEQIDPLAPKGSYAGAMGRGQFMPSSYRNYAVDFDGDGRRDLFNNLPDAIGSVANYFRGHGWVPGAPVVERARVTGNAFAPLLEKGMKPELTVQAIAGYGAVPVLPLPPEALATLLSYENVNDTEYWIGLQNFYVITRYNHSIRYAMAVHQLSEEILARHQGR